MNQIAELEALARTRDWTIVEVCDETASGVDRKRPVLARVRELAHRGAIDVLAIWALDRLGRSMRETVDLVLELERCGVELVSLREPWLDVGGPVRELLVSIFAWVAEQDRRRIVERVRAGMARARAEGKELGHKSKLSPEQIRSMVTGGKSLRAVARELGTSLSSVRRAVARSSE